LLVLEDDTTLDEAIRYLARLGYDKVVGFLRGGTESWYNAGLPIEDLPLLPVHELKGKLDRKDSFTLLDVRRQDEWDRGHVEGAQHIYVGHLEKKLSEVPRDKPIVVMCSVGNRSGMAASILLRTGYTHVQSVPGSIVAWRSAGYPLIK
jgi:hydroxyacylglutathione hydrolase